MIRLWSAVIIRVFHEGGGRPLPSWSPLVTIPGMGEATDAVPLGELQLVNEGLLGVANRAP